MQKTQRIRTTCRGCGKMECGVWVTVEAGRAVKIEGDSDSFQSRGNVCTKSLASLQAVYHPDRIKYPLKRTRPKGEDPGWVRISWEEALETTARKLKEIQARYGGKGIFTMGGTSRIWPMGAFSAFKQLVQTPNSVVAFQICKGPRHFATKLTDEFASSWMATVDNPKVYVQWGASPEISNYDDSARTTVDVINSAEKFINVNPRLSNAGKDADIWLPLKPGTDAAMALSWIDVIIRNNLYDELFCKRWTNGPFLHCPDVDPDGGMHDNGWGFEFQLKTRLLKESDILEGGSSKRFMVWDQLKNRLTYFDADTILWEGETFKAPTEGIHIQGGFLPEPSKFDPPIDPAIFGQFPVTLKNGKTSIVTPVFQLFADRAAQYTPSKAEKITGVPAEQIELAAKTYASRFDERYGNGGIQYMLGIEHSGNCIQNVRALALLVGITGNFDGPAGHRGPTKANVIPAIGGGAPGAPSYPLDDILGVDRFPLLKWWGGVWADASSVWEAVHTGKPYPVKAGICQASSFVVMCNTTYVWEALKKLEFFVAIDLWHHPTVEMADIVFPACHWLEVDCARMSQGGSGGLGANVRCIEPLGECKPDYEIVQLIFKEMGVPYGPDPANPWPGAEADLDMAVAGSGMSWKAYKEKFQNEGWFDVKKLFPDHWGTYRRYETGVLRRPLDAPPGQLIENFFMVNTEREPVPGFNTPTGKQEIWSTVLETFMPNRNYELPDFEYPSESRELSPDLSKKYPIMMITGRRIPVYFHTEHRQLPWCREQWPVPLVEINPETAAKYGIAHGDWVWIENDRGRIRQKADLYHGIAPDIINCEHSWWYPEMPAPEHGWRYSCVNQLVDNHSQDPICGSVHLRGYPVRIYKAEEGAPEGIIISRDDSRLKRWASLNREEASCKK
ncbi:MAG: molybdopterin-dependent oxidoreductase [Pseudomonadota bacterium]